MIVDRIQPPVADLISVQSIRVDDNDEVPRYAFCVQVKSGNTAYQSIDKYYYCRRDGASIAMDDKDIRLRMLSPDRPRIEVNLVSEISNISARQITSVKWNIIIRNIGIKTVKRAFIETRMSVCGFSDLWMKFFQTCNKDLMTDFGGNDLMPGQEWRYVVFDLSTMILREANPER
jgi:hypothetical protein